MKGIIIAAGYGTRFLPATKTVPKEMFPLIDTPAIDFIIDEFIESGIDEILIVSSRRKKILEDYFDREIELESLFTRENAKAKLKAIKPREASFYFIRQQKMLGTGHAILQCREFASGSPVVIAYPDDIVLSDPPLSKQLIDIHLKSGQSVLAVQEQKGDVSRYGVIDYAENNGIMSVKRFVEKPPAGEEPSKMVSYGRYLFTYDLFDLLEEDYKKHTSGEFYHVGAINTLADTGRLAACSFSGTRYDVGDKQGYLQAVIEYALSRDDLREETIEFMKRCLKDQV
jgi:UTP--glucose-1-phosphate uridylyltransferase